MTTVTDQDFEQLEVQLFLTRQYLLMAVSQLPKRELKVSLKEQAELSQQPFKLQAKSDDKGTTFFRAVKTFG